MTTEITAADISSGEDALQQMGQSDLDKGYWHFSWDDAATLFADAGWARPRHILDAKNP